MTRRARIGAIIAALAALQLAVLLVYRVVEGGRGSAERAAPFRVEPLAANQAAPAFTATRHDGSSTALAWPAPRARLVHFWGTWCEPCRRELPSLVAFARATPGIEVVAVAVEDDWPSIAAFFGGAVPPEVVIATDAVHKRYGATLLPDSYLVDRAGVLVERYHGARAWESPAARAHLAPFAR